MPVYRKTMIQKYTNKLQSLEQRQLLASLGDILENCLSNTTCATSDIPDCDTFEFLQGRGTPDLSSTAALSNSTGIDNGVRAYKNYYGDIKLKNTISAACASQVASSMPTLVANYEAATNTTLALGEEAFFKRQALAMETLATLVPSVFQFENPGDLGAQGQFGTAQADKTTAPYNIQRVGELLNNGTMPADATAATSVFQKFMDVTSDTVYFFLDNTVNKMSAILGSWINTPLAQSLPDYEIVPVVNGTSTLKVDGGVYSNVAKNALPNDIRTCADAMYTELKASTMCPLSSTFLPANACDINMLTSGQVICQDKVGVFVNGIVYESLHNVQASITMTPSATPTATPKPTYTPIKNINEMPAADYATLVDEWLALL